MTRRSLFKALAATPFIGAAKAVIAETKTQPCNLLSGMLRSPYFRIDLGPSLRRRNDWKSMCSGTVLIDRIS